MKGFDIDKHTRRALLQEPLVCGATVASLVQGKCHSSYQLPFLVRELVSKMHRNVFSSSHPYPLLTGDVFNEFPQSGRPARLAADTTM